MNTRHLLPWLGLIAAWALPGVAASPALDMVRDGRPSAEIIVPIGAPSAEAFAANDLQRWVREITGATVPILPEPSAATNTKLYFGKKSAAQWTQELAELAGTDGFAIRQKGNEVYVFGDLPRGTAYGAYHLLEVNTDIIWARPDEAFGTVFGRTPNLALKNVEALEKPAFRLHGWNVVAVRRHRPTGIWVYRNRGNFADQADVDDLGMLRLYGGGHSYFSTMVPPNANFGDKAHNYFATNPEWYGWDATKGGRYPETLCLTAAALPAVSVSNLLVGANANPPPADFLHLGMRDTWVMCQCPECKKPIALPNGGELKMRDPDAEKDPLFASTRYFLFMNRLAAELRKAHSEIPILAAAYFYAAEPPACAVDPGVLPLFCPIGGRNNRFPLLDERQDPTWRERFVKWRQVANGRLAFYEYYRSYGSGRADLMYGAVSSAWAPDLKALAESRGVGVISELTPDVDRAFSNHSMQSEWDANGINAWILARLFWNPRADVGALRDLYLERTFREAAPPMKRFYDLMQQGWDKCTVPKRGFQAWVVDAGIEPACARALDEAEKLAVHPGSREMVRRLKAEWAKASSSLGRMAVPNVPEAKDAALRFDDPSWQKALVLSDFRVPSCWDWGTRNSPRCPTEVRLLHDGVRLWFRFSATSPGSPPSTVAAPPAGSESWPRDDHGELYLENKAGLCLFAFDGQGTRHDSRGFDRRWNSGWQLIPRVTASGWEAIGAIPLASLGYRPNDADAALSLFVLRQATDGGPMEESTLYGGVLRQRTRYPLSLEPK